MSGIAHPYVPVRLRLRSSHLMLLVATLLLVGATFLAVAVSSGTSESARSNVVPVRPRGGPSESSRGQAASSAAGSSQPTQAGGPNEATRGNAAAGASRP